MINNKNKKKLIKEIKKNKKIKEKNGKKSKIYNNRR